MTVVEITGLSYPAVRAVIGKKNELFYLPSYSPQLNTLSFGVSRP